MKKLIIALCLTSLSAVAQENAVPVNEIAVEMVPFGSGTPSTKLAPGQIEVADYVADGMFHVPGFLPGFPTSQTIWPRLIQVPCKKTPTGKPVCAGYNINPAVGRGEYIFIVPVMQVEPEPIVLPPVPKEMPMVLEPYHEPPVVKKIVKRKRKIAVAECKK